MKRNKVIQLAIAITKVTFVLTIFIFIVIVVMVIHWHIDKQFYENFYLANEFQAGLNSFNVILSDKNLTNIPLNKLSHGTMYWILIRNGMILTSFLVIQKLIIDVLSSIKNLETFYDQNVRIFKRIAVIGFILTVIACFNFGTVDGKTIWNFTIPFQPLFFSSSFLVLAEVFKEGKKLLEDSNSIV